MLLAPFLWIFCEFDEKVLDNLSLKGGHGTFCFGRCGPGRLFRFGFGQKTGALQSWAQGEIQHHRAQGGRHAVYKGDASGDLGGRKAVCS